MSDFEQFKRDLHAEGVRYIESAMNEQPIELGQAMVNWVFDLEGPHQLERPIARPNLDYKEALHAFIEISTSIQTLQEIASFVGGPASRSKLVRPERLLQIMIEHFFGEVYLLRGRLTFFITLIQRQAKLSSSSRDFKKCEDLKNLVSESLKSLTDIRNDHVHKCRLSDPDIEKLITLGSILNELSQPVDELMRRHHLRELRRIRRHWKERMLTVVSVVIELANFVFSALHPMTFSNGRFLPLRYT